MVSIICCTMRNSYMKNVLSNYDRQTIKNKEMIIVLNHDDMNIDVWKKETKKYANVTVYQLPEIYELGKCLNYGIKKAKYEIIAKFDDDDYYAPDYLVESLIAFKKTDASIVGKKTSYVYFEEDKALMLFRKDEEHKYCKKVKGGTLVFRRPVWDKVKFDERRKYGSDTHFLKKCIKGGFKIYSVSRHNYVCIRRKDFDTHTQKKSTEMYKSSCEMICQTNRYIPIITKKLENKHNHVP